MYLYAGFFRISSGYSSGTQSIPGTARQYHMAPRRGFVLFVRVSELYPDDILRNLYIGAKSVFKANLVF